MEHWKSRQQGNEAEDRAWHADSFRERIHNKKSRGTLLRVIHRSLSLDDNVAWWWWWCIFFFFPYLLLAAGSLFLSCRYPFPIPRSPGISHLHTSIFLLFLSFPTIHLVASSLPAFLFLGSSRRMILSTGPNNLWKPSLPRVATLTSLLLTTLAARGLSSSRASSPK